MNCVFCEHSAASGPGVSILGARKAYIVGGIIEDRFFHRTLALKPFVILTTLFLLPLLKMLGALPVDGEDCLVVFG